MATETLVYYPGHLEPKPVTIFRSRPGKIVWQNPGIVMKVPKRDAMSLIRDGGFLAALTLDEAKQKLVAKSNAAVKRLDLTVSEYQPKDDKAFVVYVLDEKFLAAQRATSKEK